MSVEYGRTVIGRRRRTMVPRAIHINQPVHRGPMMKLALSQKATFLAGVSALVLARADIVINIDYHGILER